jgi:hypothetical protein
MGKIKRCFDNAYFNFLGDIYDKGIVINSTEDIRDKYYNAPTGTIVYINDKHIYIKLPAKHMWDRYTINRKKRRFYLKHYMGDSTLSHVRVENYEFPPSDHVVKSVEFKKQNNIELTEDEKTVEKPMTFWEEMACMLLGMLLCILVYYILVGIWSVIKFIFLVFISILF